MKTEHEEWAAENHIHCKLMYLKFKIMEKENIYYLKL